MDALPIEELNEHLPYCSTQKKGRKELRKRKKRKTSTHQTSSPQKAKEGEEEEPQAPSDNNGAVSTCNVAPFENMGTPATILPPPSTITTTTVGAPPAPGAAGDDDDSEFQISTAAAHMCGHDGHMAMVLGLCAMVVRNAHLLPEDTFVRFVFQPAEEGPGGAMKMIEDGALTDVDEIYGLHNAPFPLNSIHVRPGAVMAHEVEFSIDIHGIGGHGSAPQQCVDPILAGSAVVQALQSVVSRSLSPMDTAVVSVTQFRGGDANNVIPSSAYLAGTIRDFDLQIAEKIKSRVATLVHSTCAAYGATASVHFLDGYAPVINPPVETRNVQQVAMDMGLFVSEEGLPLMAAEDFSYFLQERKGCYFFLGTKEPGDAEKTRALHSNHFDFNDKAIPVGIRLFLGILQSRFNCELYNTEELQAFQVAMERILINVTLGSSTATPTWCSMCWSSTRIGWWPPRAEAHPSPVPAVANSVKSTMAKKNGEVKAEVAVSVDTKMGDSDGEANGAALDSNEAISESSGEEEKNTSATVTAEDATKLKSAVQKRSDYLSWDDYFMSVAFLSAMRSKGWMGIVSPERKIVGIGYNGFPNGCGDDDLPWARESKTNSPLDTKYPLEVRGITPALGHGRCGIHAAQAPALEGCHRLHLRSIEDQLSTDGKQCRKRELKSSTSKIYCHPPYSRGTRTGLAIYKALPSISLLSGLPLRHNVAGDGAAAEVEVVRAKGKDLDTVVLVDDGHGCTCRRRSSSA
ncbi:hypothetical protein ON010_g7788 [Phytophthora cinnamomi]|nr:hypothetical protein ON010_g7788 [Phytophthora cinnamomi]